MTIGGWLTARRLRAHAVLLGLALWSIYAWVLWTPGLRDRNGNLKGTDFLHLYTLGVLADEHRGADLYDMQAQAEVAAARVPEAAGIRYLPLYPPQVSLLFAPFADFSYARALALWWILSASLYGACCWSVWRVCPNLRTFGWTVCLLAAAFPAFFHLIAWGQTSALALATFTGFFLLMRGRRDFYAGVVLGLLIFKPQLGLAAAIVLAAMGAWRVIAGALLSAAAEFGIGVAYYGFAPLDAWLRRMWNVRDLVMLLEPRPYQTHCLRTFWSMLSPWPSLSWALYLISAAVVLAWTILIWKRSKQWAPRFSSLLLATVLVAPHLTAYDLVILAPAFMLLADWILAQPNRSRSVGIALYLAYMLPLIGPLSRWTHLQLSVVAMCAVVYLVGKKVLSIASSAQPE